MLESKATELTMEIDPFDEVTLVDRAWLKRHGFGSPTTLWRKVKSKQFPAPVINDDGKLKWTLAQIKKYLADKMGNQTTQAAV